MMGLNRVFVRFKQHFSCCQPSAEVLCLAAGFVEVSEYLCELWIAQMAWISLCFSESGFTGLVEFQDCDGNKKATKDCSSVALWGMIYRYIILR